MESKTKMQTDRQAHDLQFMGAMHELGEALENVKRFIPRPSSDGTLNPLAIAQGLEAFAAMMRREAQG